MTKKMIPGPFKEIVEGPTEHGGTFSVTYYFDSKYKPIAKEKATRVIMHEYDSKSRSLYRIYQTINTESEVSSKGGSDKLNKIITIATSETTAMVKTDATISSLPADAPAPFKPRARPQQKPRNKNQPNPKMKKPPYPKNNPRKGQPQPNRPK